MAELEALDHQQVDPLLAQRLAEMKFSLGARRMFAANAVSTVGDLLKLTAEDLDSVAFPVVFEIKRMLQDLGVGFAQSA